MKLILLYYFEALNETKFLKLLILDNFRTERWHSGLAQHVNSSGYRSGLQVHLGGRD